MLSDGYSFADNTPGSYEYKVFNNNWAILGILDIYMSIYSVLPIRTMEITIKNECAGSNIDMITDGNTLLTIDECIAYTRKIANLKTSIFA